MPNLLLMTTIPSCAGKEELVPSSPTTFRVVSNTPRSYSRGPHPRCLHQGLLLWREADSPRGRVLAEDHHGGPADVPLVHNVRPLRAFLWCRGNHQHEPQPDRKVSGQQGLHGPYLAAEALV